MFVQKGYFNDQSDDQTNSKPQEINSRNNNVRSFLQKNFLETNNEEKKPSYLEKIKSPSLQTQTTANLMLAKKKQDLSYHPENNEFELGEDLKMTESQKNEDFNQTQVGFQRSSTTGFAGVRPSSSSSQSNLNRTKFLELQKEKLKNKQQGLYQAGVNVHQNPNYGNNIVGSPSFFSEKENKSNKPFNYEDLNRVMKNEVREQYEPGVHNKQTLKIPGLKKEDHVISFKEKETHDQLEEIMLEDPVEKKEEVITKGIDDSEMQRISAILPPPKEEKETVKIDNEEIDEETLRLAKELKKLKGNNNGNLVMKIIQNGNEETKETKEPKEMSEKLKESVKHEKKNEIIEKENEEDKNEDEEALVQPDNNDDKIDKTIKIFNQFYIKNMKEFVTNPIPKNTIVQCVIKRERSGWNKIYPKYKLFFSVPKGAGAGSGYLQGGFLMAAKKRSGNKSSNYMISLSSDDFKKGSSNILGKLRSNFLGTEFHIYDIGDNPKKARMMESIRKELGVVTYETNFFGSKGPRKMKTLIPHVKPDNNANIWRPIKPEDGMNNYFKSGKREGITFLFNKPPKWNDNMGAFVLNFNGRVEKPSVKNFQLIDETDDNYIYLQFGRISNEEFTMDFMWPLTPFQAFTICLSSFDYKIACE